MSEAKGWRVSGFFLLKNCRALAADWAGQERRPVRGNDVADGAFELEKEGGGGLAGLMAVGAEVIVLFAFGVVEVW